MYIANSMHCLFEKHFILFTDMERKALQISLTCTLELLNFYFKK